MNSEGKQTLTLTDNILDFISDFESVEFAKEFVKKNGLKDDDVSRVMNLAVDVVYGTVAVDTLPAEMTSRFGIDATKSKQAALELAEARLLPIQEVIPGVAQQVKVWGGELKVSQSSESTPLSPDVFVQTSLQDVVKEMPVHLQGRLSHILELYVSKHSDRALVMDMLTRSEKVGGVAFGKEDAEGLLAYTDEKMKGKVIGGSEMSERSEMAEKKMETVAVVGVPLVGTHVTETEKLQIPQPQPQTQPPTSTPTEKLQPQPNSSLRRGEGTPPITEKSVHDDAAEIEQVKIIKQSVMETPKHEPMTIEEMVGEICTLEPMQLPDGTLVDRCKQIIESRLREVRTASDTQKQIERSVETGGLGISGRKLADMTQTIEQAFDRLQQHASEKVAQEKVAYLEKKQAQETAKQTTAEKEEKMMTKRYVELTGKMPDAHVSPAAPSSARVSGAVSKDVAMDQRTQSIDTAKVRTVIEATKKETDVRPLPTSSQGKGARPEMQDVKFVKRLSGPIDELRSVSLIDFRRMAKTPELAMEKMVSLVHLVEDQGYDKRVEAIRAWQSSPLYQQYLTIARNAMQEGKPLEEMRSAVAKSGETLSKEELAAILKLNGELRF